MYMHPWKCRTFALLGLSLNMTPTSAWANDSEHNPTWTTVRSGTYQMGDPDYLDEDTPNRENSIPHMVTLTHEFRIQTTEVTIGEWKRIMGESNVPNSIAQCSDHCPVNTVNWMSAIEYANALSVSEGLEPCYLIEGRTVAWTEGFECTGYRLPTEAEWEYAARAGSTATRHGDIDAISWTKRTANGTVQPVGQLAPNDWNLYDMHGNVWEWVWDIYGDFTTEAVTDPTGPKEGRSRVRRGGGANDHPRQTCVFYRERRVIYRDLKRQGFRLVQTIHGTEE